MTAHEELLARLDDYRKAVSVYESPDPHDREEARYDAMHAARARLCDVALAEALLAEIDALRAQRDRLRYGMRLVIKGAAEGADRAIAEAECALDWEAP